MVLYSKSLSQPSSQGALPPLYSTTVASNDSYLLMFNYLLVISYD